jgi:hypothetical protein
MGCSVWQSVGSSQFQNIIALAALFGVGAYVYLTYKLLQTSIKQGEGQIRPALIIRRRTQDAHEYEVVNLGSGPAVSVSWKFDSTPQLPAGKALFIEKSQTHMILPRYALDGVVVNKVECRYKSLSGTDYTSRLTFQDAGDPILELLT